MEGFFVKNFPKKFSKKQAIYFWPFLNLKNYSLSSLISIEEILVRPVPQVTGKRQNKSSIAESFIVNLKDSNWYEVPKNDCPLLWNSTDLLFIFTCVMHRDFLWDKFLFSFHPIVLNTYTFKHRLFLFFRCCGAIILKQVLPL